MGRRGCSGCLRGSRRNRPVSECGMRHQLLGVALRDHPAAELARAGAEVDHVVGAADGVLVVLDHHQRVALGARASRARRAGSGCRGGAGRWSARRGCSTRRAGSSRAAPPAGCAAPRRPRASAPSGRASGSRGRPRRGSRGGEFSSATMSRAISASRPCQRDVFEDNLQVLDRLRRVLGDALALPAHRERFRVQPLAVAVGAGLVDLQPLDPRVEHVVLGAGARALVVSTPRPSSCSPVP